MTFKIPTIRVKRGRGVTKRQRKRLDAIYCDLLDRRKWGFLEVLLRAELETRMCSAKRK